MADDAFEFPLKLRVEPGSIEDRLELLEAMLYLGFSGWMEDAEREAFCAGYEAHCPASGTPAQTARMNAEIRIEAERRKAREKADAAIREVDRAVAAGAHFDFGRPPDGA